jgi:hypothetical protein
MELPILQGVDRVAHDLRLGRAITTALKSEKYVSVVEGDAGLHPRATLASSIQASVYRP